MHESLTVTEYVAQRLMKESGYPQKDDSIEWDKDNPDSQYAINLDIADLCVNATVDALKLIGVLPEEVEPNASETTDQYTVEHAYPIHRQATIYLFLKSEQGQPLTLGDVRDWMYEVDELNLSDETIVEGGLELMYDIGLSVIERDKSGSTILHPREDSADHPAVLGKKEREILERTYQTLIKKHAYLVEQGDNVEAARILDEIQRIKDAAGR